MQPTRPKTTESPSAALASTPARAAAPNLKLINIDNGGTLTDICVFDGDRVYRTKTLTTPYDLSRCLFDGLRKVSNQIYGREDLLQLLLSTAHIRYSTTQGTNALVERKGPRLGLIVDGRLHPSDMASEPRTRAMLDVLLGNRIATLDVALGELDLERAVTSAVNGLTAAGASRIVVAFGGPNHLAQERRVKRIILRTYPPHLLGATPMLYSHELVADENDVRRAWTAIFNAFLHPEMERFLYAAEHTLRESHARNPLLIFRNDGHSARVAKTIAIKTYSSGPRGGMEASRVLAAHYGFAQLLSMDVGGTTTDIGMVQHGQVRSLDRGEVEGVSISYPLCDVRSVGVGGSSIVKVEGAEVLIGPESVGSTPGPACFSLGGTLATITDAFLVQGLLDPSTYFGGELSIDAGRARAAIEANVAKPLQASVEQASLLMESAWVAKIASSLKTFAAVGPDTTLAAFGGAGPLVVCKVAAAAGISRVLIPGLAAVFSAFGIGFSDIAHQYDSRLATVDAAVLTAAIEDLRMKAMRGMRAEGFDLRDCEVRMWLQVVDGKNDQVIPIADGGLPAGLPAGAAVTLSLMPVMKIPRPALTGRFGGVVRSPKITGRRSLLIDGERREVPVYRREGQPSGVRVAGPAVLEEAFYTCRIDTGWGFEINESGDILLCRAGGAP